jgi:hypothetical protein
LLFYQTFFDEWFTLLPSTAFPQDSATIPNFKFLSRHAIDHNPAAFFANTPNIISNSDSSSNFSDKFLNLNYLTIYGKNMVQEQFIYNNT